MTRTYQSIRRGVAALVAVALAMALAIVGFAPAANAEESQVDLATGVSLTLNYNPTGTIGDLPSMQEGAEATFQVRYDSSVEPGSSVSFLVPEQFVLDSTPPTNKAVAGIEHDPATNIVTLTFANPWPDDVYEGVLSFTSKLTAEEGSSEQTMNWGLVDDPKTFQIYVLKSGDNPVTVKDHVSKAVVSDNFGDIFNLKGETVSKKSDSVVANVNYSIKVDSAEARENAVITDTLGGGLEYVKDSFKLNITTYDENGLNPKTETIDIPAADITFTGTSFSYTYDFPAKSKAELTYSTKVTDLDAVQASLNEQLAESNVATHKFNNTATVDGSGELKASREFRFSLPTVGPNTFGKTGSWDHKFVEFDEDGKLTSEYENLAIDWTLTADLTQFNADNRYKTLNHNVVLTDTLPAGLSWNLPEGNLPVVAGSDTVNFERVEFTGDAADFQGDAYVGKWTILDGKLLINFGKDTTKKYSVTLATVISDASALSESNNTFGFAGAIAKSGKNTAVFNWTDGNRAVEDNLNIIDRDGNGDGPWNSDQFFNKTAPGGTISVNPGDTVDVNFALEIKAGPNAELGHDVDLSKVTLIDYVDHNVFDVTADTLETIRSNSKVYYNNSQLAADDYTITLDEDGNIRIKLTEAGVGKIGDGKGSLKADLVLTTKPIQGKQAITVTNQAAVLGENGEEIYESSTTASTSSFGDEAQITKDVRDQDNGEWTKNLRTEVDGNDLGDDTYVYRIQYIAHGSFGNLAITPVVDQLPEGVEFVGFLADGNVDDEQNPITTGSHEIGEGLVATYDANEGPAGAVTIANKEGTKISTGATAWVNLLVKIVDFDEDTPIVNQIRNTGATITPTNGYPLSVQKLDSSDDEKVINDSNARFQVLDSEGNVVVDNAFVQNGYLRVLDEDGNVKGLIVDEPGTYTVKEIKAPAGYAATDEVLTFKVETDQVPEGQVLYNDPETYAIGDYTWIDANRDGIQDDEEEILAGVTVTITDAEGNPVTDFNGVEVEPTKTDDNGLYVFDNLVAGDYKITFTLTPEQATAYAFTTQNTGNETSTNDSDADPATGMTKVISLNKANTNLTKEYSNVSGTEIAATEGIDPTWDAGVVNKSYAVGDYTWIDSNRDGIQDENEPVLPGVKVTLLDNAGEVLKTTETDENGFYVFDELPEGKYQIKFELTEDQAAKYNFTKPNQGTDGAVNSDANPETGITVHFDLNDSNNHLTTDYTNASGTEIKASRGIDPTWDAGVVEKSYAVGDFTWIDSNKNGVQDADEPILPGVKVEITDAEGNPVKDIFGETVAATETDEEGFYLFDNLKAGEYQIKFTLTEDQAKIYRFTTQNTGNDESTNDSDAHPTTGITTTITLNSANKHLDTDYKGVQATEGIDPTWDAGVIGKTYAVGDFTWIDENRDGIQDENEPVLPGVKVELLDNEGNVLEETVTDENGFYLFDERAAGEYQLRFTLTDEQAAKYKFTSQNTGEIGEDSDVDAAGLTKKFTLNDENEQLTTEYSNASETVVKATEGIDPTWDAGVVIKTYALGDYTWIDSNRDGIQDEGEPVLPGVTVNLLDEKGEQIGTTTTDENGLYLFDNLPGGKYQIEFVLTEEQSVKYIFTNSDAGENDALDSDANTTTGKTIQITLDDSNQALTTDYTNASNLVVKASEGIDPTWDAGVIERSYAIGDYTWIDENRDGIQDEDEPVLPGVTVEITDAEGNPVKDVYGNTVEPTVTDKDGKYVFDNLPAGDYKMTFILPEDVANEYVFTPQNQGDDKATDSDADQNGKTTTVTLGETNKSLTKDYDGDVKATEGIDPTWDAGVVKKSYAVGDYTWIDENRDGIQDENEPVLPGVKVTITDAEGKPVVDVYGKEVAATETDENGFYVFDNLPKGDYVITFEIPEDYADTHVFTKAGTAGADDSDADRVTGKTITISLTDSNEYLTKDYSNASDTVISATQGIDPTWDAGIVTKSYAIGDFTWIDVDKDGVQDADEPVLPGVKVELLDADGKVVAETVTDENGYYLFDDLAAGEYQIRFTLTEEQAKTYEFTSQNTGERANDSDADSAGLTVKIVLDDSNEYLTQEYSIADILATQGIDPTWDAGVVVKPGETLPPVPTDDPDSTTGNGGDKGDDLASTGAQGLVPLAIVAAVLALAGLGILLAMRRRNQQV